MRTNRTLVFRLLLWVALLMCSTAVALAQSAQTDEYPKIEVFAGYSALGEVNGRGISFGTASINANYAGKAGFETSLIRNFSKHIGIKGDFSAHFDNSSGSRLITSVRLRAPQPHKTFSSKRAFSIFWAARNLKRVTARASRRSLTFSPARPTPARDLLRLVPRSTLF